MPKEGGNAVKPETSPAIGTKICSLIAIPKKGLRKPAVFAATNIDELAKATSEAFNFELKKSSGSMVKETYLVEKYEDIELETICEKSAILSQQDFELNFLREFIKKWRGDVNFRAYFIALLKNKGRKEQTVKALKLIQLAIEQKQVPSSFLQFLNEI